MKKNLLAQCEHCQNKNSGHFCFLKAADIESISHKKITISYKKGQTLFIQGSHSDGMYCISKGNVKISQHGVNNNESILRLLNAGDIVGCRTIVNHDHYTWTATAIEDVEACFLETDLIIQIIKSNPIFALPIISSLSKKLGVIENQLSSYHYKNVRERFLDLLYSLKEDHGHREGALTKIDLQLSREELAHIIGTTEETLNHFMSEFKHAGILDHEGKILRITNENELNKWMHGSV